MSSAKYEQRVVPGSVPEHIAILTLPSSLARPVRTLTMASVISCVLEEKLIAINPYASYHDERAENHNCYCDCGEE